MASDMNDGILIADKQFVGIRHIRSIFESDLNIHNVSTIDIWKRNSWESNPRPLSRESNVLIIISPGHRALWKDILLSYL